MEDIVIDNIVIDSIETPIFIRLGKRNARAFAHEAGFGEGRTRNIQISHISGSAAGTISCAVTAYAGNAIRDLSLSDITLSFPGGGTEADVAGEVPEVAESYPINRMFGTNLPSYGFYIRHVSGLHMENILLRLRDADARPAIVLDDVHHMTLRDLDAAKAGPAIPVVPGNGITS